MLICVVIGVMGLAINLMIVLNHDERTFFVEIIRKKLHV